MISQQAIRSQRALAGVCIAAAFTFAACGDASPDLGLEDDASLEGKADSAGTNALKGAWKQYQGQGMWAGAVFESSTRGRALKFDQIIYCLTTPCNPVRTEGKWTATASTKRLTLTLGTQVLRYTYSMSGGVLTIKDGTRVVAKMKKQTTYCAAAADCEGQTYVHPACVGAATCSTTTATCGWRCGTPVNPCANYRCTTGEHCEVGEDLQPHCTPDTMENNACMRMRCTAERPHCVYWAATNEAACIAPDQCNRDADCPANTRCQPANTCVRAPCFSPLVCR